jgi:hypothetical protein
MRRIDREDLADYEPVKQHADGGEVQFDGRLGGGRLQRLYIRRDVDGLDIGELADAVLLNPGEEVAELPRRVESRHSRSHTFLRISEPPRVRRG